MCGARPLTAALTTGQVNWGKDQQAGQQKHGNKVLQGMQGDSGLGVDGVWKLTEMSAGRRLTHIRARL